MQTLPGTKEPTGSDDAWHVLQAYGLVQSYHKKMLDTVTRKVADTFLQEEDLLKAYVAIIRQYKSAMDPIAPALIEICPSVADALKQVQEKVNTTFTDAIEIFEEYLKPDPPVV